MALYLFLADAVFFKRKHTHPNRRRARRLLGNRSAAPHRVIAMAIRKVASRLFALCMYTSDFKFGNNEPPCRLRVSAVCHASLQCLLAAAAVVICVVCRVNVQRLSVFALRFAARAAHAASRQR
jgi:hypothetical protein